MATFDYDTLRDVDVLDVIEEMGQTDIVLKRVTKNQVSLEPWKGESVANESVTEEVVKGVPYDIDMSEQFVEGTLVASGDRLCLIAASGVTGGEPDKIDRLLFADGEEWTIVGTPMKIDPGGVMIAWVVHIRR
jgi:hypothetical protein